MPSERKPPGLPLGRRAFLSGAALLACWRNEEPDAAQPSSAAAGSAGPVVLPASGSASASASASLVASAAAGGPLLSAEERTLDFPRTPVGKMSVVVWLPERAPSQRLPLLFALHGRGETLKGPVRGARGWLDDYALARASARLRRPPLTRKDFEGLVEPERLAGLNAALAAEPFEGVAVACPFLPDMFSREEPFTGAPLYAAFLIDVLLPRLRAELPLLGTREATGIDGVSLGGRAAIAVGLSRPDVFGAVGGLQAAFDPRNASEFARRARDAFRKNSELKLHLLTSDEDHYLEATRSIHAALRGASVPHHFRVVPGPHDYVFNRGPGSLEMLVFHDRALRGRQPV